MCCAPCTHPGKETRTAHAPPVVAHRAPEYVTGCLMGQYVGVIMLLNAILGVYVAENHGKAKRAAKIVRRPSRSLP